MQCVLISLVLASFLCIVQSDTPVGDNYYFQPSSNGNKLITFGRYNDASYTLWFQSLYPLYSNYTPAATSVFLEGNWTVSTPVRTDGTVSAYLWMFNMTLSTATPPPSINDSTTSIVLSFVVYDNITGVSPCGNAGMCMTIATQIHTSGWITPNAELLGILSSLSTNASVNGTVSDFSLLLGNSQVMFNATASITNDTTTDDHVPVHVLLRGTTPATVLLAFDKLSLINNMRYTLHSDMIVCVDIVPTNNPPTVPVDHLNLVVWLVVGGGIVLVLLVVGSIILARRTKTYLPIA